MADTLSAEKSTIPCGTPRYCDPRMQAHDQRLADFFESLNDPDLVRVANLHGRPRVELRSLLTSSEDTRVLSILEDWRKLRALECNDKDVISNLTGDVLPSLADPGAAVFLVMESLDQLDPLGLIAAFTRTWPGMGQSTLTPSPTDLPLWALPVSQIAVISRVIASTAAGFFGLWEEKRRCENAALLYEDFPRMQALVDFVNQKATLTQVEDRRKAIGAIVDRIPGTSTRWEWHHAASMSRKLKGVGRDCWAQRLSACGMVTIACSSAVDCYRVLSLLHLNLDHQTIGIRDSIGTPGLSHYEAIHTIVDLPSSKPVRIRILPADKADVRNLGLTALKYQQIREELTRRRGNALKTFAYDGRLFELPLGSTILNFALKVHRQVALHATCATVNGEKVGVLHKLRDGDIVRVELGNEPSELPEDWQARVPAKSLPRLRALFRANPPGKVREGRSKLRNAIRAKCGPVAHALDDASLDSFIEDELGDFKRSHTGEVVAGGVAAWLRRYADPPRNDTEADLQSDFERRMAERIGHGEKISFDMLDIPIAMLPSINLVRRCERCRPEIGQPIMGVFSDDEGTLIIHDTNKPCSKSGLRLEWQSRWSRGYFYVLETENRKGLMAEVLSEASRRGVDLIDVSATRMGTNWAVIRLHLKPMLAKEINRVTAGLSDIPGIIRILPPGHPAVPFLEGNLPKRERSRKIFPEDAEVFVAGPVVDDDDRFYGRESELQILLSVVSRLTSKGAFVFVKGPYKIGKTSLVRKFLRDLDRPEFRCMTIETIAGYGQSWSSFEMKLRKSLIDKLKLPNQPHSKRYSSRSTIELIEKLQGRTKGSVVLFLDEATMLFAASESAGESEKLVDFLASARSIAKTTVIIAGHEAPMQLIGKLGQFALREAHQVRVAGLSHQEVWDLISARKLSYRGVRISVDKVVADAAYNDTNGNPYWCSLIALSLIASCADKSNVRFQMERYQNAREDLLLNHLAFKDRVDDQFASGPLEGLSTSVLNQLSESLVGATLMDLLECVNRGGSAWADSDLSRVLRTLRSLGTLDRKDGKWRFSCPILADHWADNKQNAKHN